MGFVSPELDVAHVAPAEWRGAVGEVAQRTARGEAHSLRAARNVPPGCVQPVHQPLQISWGLGEGEGYVTTGGRRLVAMGSKYETFSCPACIFHGSDSQGGATEQTGGHENAFTAHGWLIWPLMGRRAQRATGLAPSAARAPSRCRRGGGRPNTPRSSRRSRSARAPARGVHSHRR